MKLRIIAIILAIIVDRLKAQRESSSQFIGGYTGNVTITKEDDPQYKKEYFAVYRFSLVNEVEGLVATYLLNTNLLYNSRGLTINSYFKGLILSDTKPKQSTSEKEKSSFNNLKFKKVGYTNTKIIEFDFKENEKNKPLKLQLSLQDKDGYIYNVAVQRPFKQHRHTNFGYIVIDTLSNILPIVALCFLFIHILAYHINSIAVQTEQGKSETTQYLELYSLMAMLVSLTEYASWYSLTLYGITANDVQKRISGANFADNFFSILAFVLVFLAHIFPRVFLFAIHIDDLIKVFSKLRRKIFKQTVGVYAIHFVFILCFIPPLLIRNIEIYLGVVLVILVVRYTLKLRQNFDRKENKKLWISVAIFLLCLAARHLYVLYRLRNPYLDWKPFVTAETQWKEKLILFLYFPVLAFSILVLGYTVLKERFGNRHVVRIIEAVDAEEVVGERHVQEVQMVVRGDVRSAEKIKELSDQIGQKNEQISALKQRNGALEKILEENKTEKQELNSKVESFNALNAEIAQIKMQNSQIFENIKKLGGEDFKRDAEGFIADENNDRDEENGMEVDEEILRVLTRKLANEQKKSLKLLEKVEDYKNRSKCSICCGDDDDGDLLTENQDNTEMMVLTKCRHSFHWNCLETWRKKNDICPNCRKSLK